jgi:hypothetical protein
MCYSWCREWVFKKYGYYNEKHLMEAMTEFTKPILCKFHNICGGELPRFKPTGEINHVKLKVCKRCMPIYKSGFNHGVRRIKLKKGSRDFDLE